MSKSKIKAISITILVVVIIGVIIGVIGYFSNGFKNWDNFKPKNWFNKPDNIEQSKEYESGSILNVLTNNGVVFVSERIESTNIAENVDSAYELTATIQPNIAENKNICWSARWNNVNSEWANDKNISDYLIFDKSTTQSGNKVIVTCLKDFGEQIIITASAEADSTKKALCSVDYQKRIKSLSYVFNYGNEELSGIEIDNDGVYRLDLTNENKVYTIVPMPVYSDYTIDVNYSNIVTGNFTDTFGFGSDVELNNLSLSANITEPNKEPELSSEALKFIDGVKSIAYNQNMPLIVSNIKKSYENLSESDKFHSRVANAYQGLIICYNSLGNLDNMQKAVVEKDNLINSYITPISNAIFMNVEITSLNDFLQNALACNNENKGIIEYFIKYSSKGFVYDYTISLGFTSSSLQAIKDIEIDNGGIII